MPQPTKPAADFYLTIEGVTLPFFLAEDENGNKTWGDGLAPMLTPQVRTGGFGQEHIPPEIEVAEVVDALDGGAGFEKSRGHRNRYNYSQYLDASWGDRVLCALKQNATSAISAAPVKFFHGSDGLFLIAGDYIYEWDLSTTSWTTRDSGGGTNYKDITELDGVTYASRGPSVDYKYSVDGASWTAFTDADENADVFVTRGNSSNIAALWKVKTNVIKTTTDGQNGGVAWTGSDEVGHTSETIQSAVVVDNEIYVFKKEGFYRYTGASTETVWLTDYLDTNNGKNSYVAPDGRIYVAYGQRLLRFDPYSTEPIIACYPTREMDSLELKGDITAIGGNETHLYIAVKNAAGNSYIMKGRQNDEGEYIWHTFLYLGANDCTALIAVGPGVVHSTNPALMYSYGTAVKYTTLPRSGLKPTDDGNCRFDTTQGVLYDTYRDFGAVCFSYFLNRGAVLAGDGVSSGRPVTLKYETDRSGTETTLVSATSDGMSENNEDAEVAFHMIRPVVYMITGDESTSPTIDAWLVAATLNPRRYRIWRPVITFREYENFRGGSDTNILPAVRDLRLRLFAAVNKRLSLIDRENHTYTVRLFDIQPVSLREKGIGGAERDASQYQLTLLEIKTIQGEDLTEAIYGESTYGGGHVFG